MLGDRALLLRVRGGGGREVVVGEGRDVGEAGVGEQRLDVPAVRLGPRGLHRVVTPAARGRAERVVGEDPRELVDERRTLLALGGGRPASLLEPDDVHARVQESAQVGQVRLLLRRVVALGPGVVHRARRQVGEEGGVEHAVEASATALPELDHGFTSCATTGSAVTRQPGRRVERCVRRVRRSPSGTPHPNVGTGARSVEDPGQPGGVDVAAADHRDRAPGAVVGWQGEPSRGRDGPARLARHADGVQPRGWRRRWRPRRR